MTLPRFAVVFLAWCGHTRSRRRVGQWRRRRSAPEARGEMTATTVGNLTTAHGTVTAGGKSETYLVSAVGASVADPADRAGVAS